MIANLKKFLLCCLWERAFGLHHNLAIGKKFYNIQCWDKVFKPYAKVFHLHTPKVAGCSVVEDLSTLIGRKEVFSNELCFSSASRGLYKDTVVMVRRPRDHVLSQYEFCKAATDLAYRFIVWKHQGLPGQKSYHLPSSFGKWIDEWRYTPRFGDQGIYEDYDQCYCPWNLQTSRLQCDQPNYCYPNPDLDKALENMNTATLLGASCR